MAEYIERNATIREMKLDIEPPFKVVMKMPAADVVPRKETIEHIFADIETTRKKCFDECFKWYGNTDERRELLNYDAKLQVALALLKRHMEGEE